MLVSTFSVVAVTGYRFPPWLTGPNQAFSGDFAYLCSVVFYVCLEFSSQKSSSSPTYIISGAASFLTITEFEETDCWPCTEDW